MLCPCSLSSCSLVLDICPFHLLYFFQSSDVALFRYKRGAEKRAYELGRELRADHFGAEAQHVHVVMLHALVRGVRVVAYRGADARQLARGYRGANAGAADEHAALGVAG